MRSQLAYGELTCGTDMCVRVCEWSYRVNSVVGFACSRTLIVSVRQRPLNTYAVQGIKRRLLKQVCDFRFSA